MMKLNKYTSPALVRFEKDLSVYTTSNSSTTIEGGHANFGGEGVEDPPGRPSPKGASNKSTGIQDYNPFGGN